MIDTPPGSTAPPYRRYVPYRGMQPHKVWERTDWAISALLFLLSLILYTATLAPTLSSTSFDSPELITKSGQLRLAHIPGSPVYVWLGHLFTLLPFGELATRVNFMSAVLGAVAVALLYPLIARHLTGERLSAIGGAVFFALSLTFWSQAVISELYAPNMAFLNFTLLALLEWGAGKGRDGGRQTTSDGMRRDISSTGRWWLVAASGVFGLGLGVHLSNMLYLPAFGLFALLGLPVKAVGQSSSRSPGLLRRFDLPGGVLCLIAGLLAAIVPYVWVYFELPKVPPGDSFPRAAVGWPMFYESTFNAFHQYRFGYTLQEIPDRIMLFFHLLLRNMGPVGVPLMLVGIWRLLSTRLRCFSLLVSVMLANIVFYVNYKVPDNDVYYIPTHMVASCLAAMGFAAVGAGVRSLWLLRRRTLPDIEQAQEVRPAPAGHSLGLRARAAYPGSIGAGLPGLAVLVLLLIGAGWEWQSNYAANDLSRDLSFRDFYANALSPSVLPQGAYLYHRGASPGYDLLYYTQLCGVRPDLHIQAGPGANPPSPSPPPWPPAPVFSGITKYDCCLPDFVADDYGTNLKWYQPVLTGMFGWQGGMQYGWLNLYSVRPEQDVPADWMIPISDPASHPSHPLDEVYYTSGLSLVGVDAEPTARPGRPWRLVRYWYSHGQSTWIPPIVTVFGDHLALESHVPLNNQLEDYIRARNVKDLGLYVIREEMYLVIPSNIQPGKYSVSTARAEPQLMSLMLDPTDRKQLLSREKVVANVEVINDQGGPVPDPLAGAANKACRR